MKKIVLGLLVISSVFVNAEDSSMKNGLTNGDKKDIYSKKTILSDNEVSASCLENLKMSNDYSTKTDELKAVELDSCIKAFKSLPSK